MTAETFLLDSSAPLTSIELPSEILWPANVGIVRKALGRIRVPLAEAVMAGFASVEDAILLHKAPSSKPWSVFRLEAVPCKTSSVT